MGTKMGEGSTSGTVIIRRNLPGTKTANFSQWVEEPFDEMDSTLAVQQYIQQTIRRDPQDVEVILTAPETQDEGVWKYEHLRQFCMELNGLAVKLQAECKPETCTQMTATEQWIFLCAAHKTPKECPAIDYTRHTLDGAACLLNSNKYFPSRVSIKVTNFFNEHAVSHYFDAFDYCGPQLRRAVLQSLVLFVAESTASSHMHTFITGKYLMYLKTSPTCAGDSQYL